MTETDTPDTAIRAGFNDADVAAAPFRPISDPDAAMIQMDRIAAAIDHSPAGRDAAVLAEGRAAPRAAGPTLIAVEPDLSFALPYADWTAVRRQTKQMLAHLRDELAPRARIAIDRDVSIPHGINHLVSTEHRDLLVVGSSRDGADGQISIGHTTRQLLHDLSCPIAIAPRGLSARGQFALRRVAVGFDGGPHSHVALALARRLAEQASAELVVRGVVDDRLPSSSWTRAWVDPFRDEWLKALDDQAVALRRQLDAAVEGVQTAVSTGILRGAPGARLSELSSEVDLIVIGSRRWGVIARLLLGGAGEALARSSTAPLLIVPAAGRG
jgi:nucleotide-binding universal stress UspA family protein